MMNESGIRRITNLSAPFLLGWFLVGTAGFDLVPEAGVFNGKRILEVFVLLLLLLATLANREARQKFGAIQATIHHRFWFVLLAALLLGAVSALRFDHPGYGLLDVGMLILLTLAALATAASYRLEMAWFDRLVLLAVATTGLIAGVTEITGLLADWSMGREFSFSKMLIRFAHPRFYNQLQTFSIPLLAALPFIFNLNRRIRLVTIMLLGLQWCLLFMSGGRGTVLSVTIALTATFLMYPSLRRSWPGLHLAGLALGVVLFLGVLGMHQNFATEGGTFVEESVGRPMTHSSGRVQMWALAWQEARQHPLLGSGPARYACEFPATTPSHPHSFPFRIVAEWGIPAFLLFTCIGFWLAWRLITGSRKRVSNTHPPDVLSAMITASLIAAGLHACLSGVLIMPASQLMAVLVTGWAVGRFQQTREVGAKEHLPGRLMLMVGTLLALVISGYSTYELNHMQERAQNLQKSGYLMPRYWHWGRSCLYQYPSEGILNPVKTKN